MSKHKNRNSKGAAPAQLAAKQKTEVRIVMSEMGTPGLKEGYGFVQEAYNAALYWPGVQPLYARLRTSMPEIVMIRHAFTAWSRNIQPVVELPDKPSDDDLRYQDFIESEFENVEGGFGAFLETVINHVPFFGWGWFEALPAIRSVDWRPPGDDPWRSQADDGLIGFRRFAWRDTSSFKRWQFNDKKRLLGMVQEDLTSGDIILPIEKSLHLTFGDRNNPEGSTPLEAVWRLERIRYGLELVQGIGYEHAAGHLSVKKTAEGALTAEDKSEVKAAARAILTAQESNYALWPFGLEGEVKDITFEAAGAILDAIKHYSIMVLSLYMMQFVALNTLTNTGALASQTDSTDIAVTTYNAMLDGFAAQFDDQIGKRLYGWNKAAFPGLTKRPSITFSHLTRSLALEEMGSFLSSIKDIVPLGEDDLKSIRRRTDFLPESLPEPGDVATLPRQTESVPVEEMAKLAAEIRRAENLQGYER